MATCSACQIARGCFVVTTAACRATMLHRRATLCACATTAQRRVRSQVMQCMNKYVRRFSTWSEAVSCVCVPSTGRALKLPAVHSHLHFNHTGRTALARGSTVLAITGLGKRALLTCFLSLYCAVLRGILKRKSSPGLVEICWDDP